MKTKPDDEIIPTDCGPQGLTKREYFAGLAMQGLLAGMEQIPFKEVPGCAVDFADDLIAVLNRTSKSG